MLGLDSKDVTARFTFVGKTGPFSIPADKFSSDSFEAAVDAERLAFGVNEVKAELLQHGKILDSCAMTFARPEKPSARKVRIDGRGMTYVAGRPFFPIGVYVHPKDKKLKYLDRLKGGPFNCVIECAPQTSILNRLHKAGLMAIPKSPRSADAVRSKYAAVKDHPAVLAWYVIDEAQPDSGGCGGLTPLVDFEWWS